MTKTLKDINIMTWFGARELSHAPEHFIESPVIVGDEQKEWLREKAQGRYHIKKTSWIGNQALFEDERDLMLFNLKFG